jgi:hypothetical protein
MSLDSILIRVTGFSVLHCRVLIRQYRQETVIDGDLVRVDTVDSINSIEVLCTVLHCRVLILSIESTVSTGDLVYLLGVPDWESPVLECHHWLWCIDPPPHEYHLHTSPLDQDAVSLVKSRRKVEI